MNTEKDIFQLQLRRLATFGRKALRQAGPTKQQKKFYLYRRYR